VVLALAAVNVFGQRPTTASADGPGGSLEVYAPTRLRGGVFWMARFRVRALREIKRATLVLDPGWLEQMHLNTLEPAPIGEASRDGRMRSTSAGCRPDGRCSCSCSSRSIRRTSAAIPTTSSCTTARPFSPASIAP
jgi:hypothetical protein